MKSLSTGLVALLAFPFAARASAWESKTMQAPLSAREVERGFNIPKGWLELQLGADSKVATSYWDADGGVVGGPDAGWAWTYTTERVGMRYGLFPRVEVHAGMPFHYLRLTNDVLGTDTSGWYLGDARFGFQWEALRTFAPTTSIVVRADLKTPTGNEAPGSYIGGPSTFTTFVTTTGTHDLELTARARRQFGPIALDGELGYVVRFSGIVQYLIETNENQFAGRIKPGDRVLAAAGLLVQAGPVAVEAMPRFMAQRTTLTGVSTTGLFPGRDLQPVDGSSGWYADLDLSAVASLGRNADLVFGAALPLRGEDLQFFPIEDLQPTRGTTWSGTLLLRY